MNMAGAARPSGRRRIDTWPHTNAPWGPTWHLPAAFANPVSVGLQVSRTWFFSGMGFGLCEAAIATVAGLYGREARNVITGITLFAGFASTVEWPSSAVLIDAFRWPGAALA